MGSPPVPRPQGGFSDVDAAAAPDVFVSYLDFLRRSDRWPLWKAETLELLELRAGDRFLDVGCGTGGEVLAAAHHAGGAGLCVGLDRSRAMAHEARRRHGDVGCFIVGDAAVLPFRDAVFGAVRAERTLQHVQAPASAISEMARVLAPGGSMVVLEPDWDTFVVSSPLEDVGRRVFAHRRHANPSRTVGRHLPALMTAAGLRVEVVEGRLSTTTSYQLAQTTLNLEAKARGAAQATCNGEGTTQCGVARVCSCPRDRRLRRDRRRCRMMLSRWPEGST